ncbi:hypothetical protein CLU85_2676 [Acidovorax sp. 69]|uniref:hypothetical protein n=1 Tax=Acidovorax sp. 69 TaxID=2035202 RepID=UPI000CB2B555|nr:hypothetical protein [Acidovorax sp. 69]PJI97876.1 hypothetical protein CLU85_2676 [Acidovorax sp. 69]
MLPLTKPNPIRFTTAGVAPRHPGLERMASWLQRRWQSACRRAERPDRAVPYY